MPVFFKWGKKKWKETDNLQWVKSVWLLQRKCVSGAKCLNALQAPGGEVWGSAQCNQGIW